MTVFLQASGSKLVPDQHQISFFLSIAIGSNWNVFGCEGSLVATFRGGGGTDLGLVSFPRRR